MILYEEQTIRCACRCQAAARISQWAAYCRRSEPHAQSEFDLPLAIEICGIDVERLAEGSGVGLEPGKKVERRQRRKAPRSKVVARGFNFGDVLMVEDVKALGEQFQVA